MAITDGEQGIINEAAQTGFASEKVERSLVGSIVSDYDRCAHLVPELRDDDFFFGNNRMAFKAVKRALEERLAVDFVTVDQELQKIDPERGRNVTIHLVGCVGEAQSWNAESYCKIVKELAARRRAIALIGEIEKELKDPANTVNSVVDKLRGSTGDLMVGGHEWVSMRDVLMNTYAHIEKRVKGEIVSIGTGINNLDNVVGGFFGGELTVVGARPGVGKSIFGMNAAIAAAKKGFRVGVCSREMIDIQYGQRILSYASGVNGTKIRKAQLKDEDWVLLAGCLGETSALPVEFLFDVRTVGDLRAEVQRKYNKGEIDMLVVDYLQLMDAGQKFKEDRLRVGYISAALKEISKDFNIPVIALAQVKRYAGGARARMPTLEDLKDSGSIEQDADNVIFLHTPFDQEDEFVDPRDKDYFQSYVRQGYTYLSLGVAKQRNGETGVCCILLDKKKMRYLAIDREPGERDA